jgi:hypothetical protein
MTLAEIILVVAGGIGMYFVLRPLQQWIEAYLLRTFARRPRLHRPTIDVTEFSSYPSRKKEDHEHRS